jgi:hypothetical protein
MIKSSFFSIFCESFFAKLEMASGTKKSAKGIPRLNTEDIQRFLDQTDSGSSKPHTSTTERETSGRIYEDYGIAPDASSSSGPSGGDSGSEELGSKPKKAGGGGGGGILKMLVKRKIEIIVLVAVLLAVAFILWRKYGGASSSTSSFQKEQDEKRGSSKNEDDEDDDDDDVDKDEIRKQLLLNAEKKYMQLFEHAKSLTNQLESAKMRNAALERHVEELARAQVPAQVSAQAPAQAPAPAQQPQPQAQAQAQAQPQAQPQVQVQVPVQAQSQAQTQTQHDGVMAPIFNGQDYLTRQRLGSAGPYTIPSQQQQQQIIP